MDSFKGSLSSIEACDAVVAGLSAFNPDFEIALHPIADGGEGSLDALGVSLDATYVPVRVMGPLPQMQVDTHFIWLPQRRIAVVEMAKASGLTLLASSMLNPMKTTTYGTGQLIAATCRMNPDKILLAVGGSATVDGGIGACAALGWKFTDKNGGELIYGGQVLERIAAIERPQGLKLPPIEVLCDVDNPLCGELGAAAVFAPQKGADADMVKSLEAGMLNLAAIVKDSLAIDMNIPRAGASGGLAGGAYAFMNARLVSGIDTFINLLGLEDEIREADCVITGEGRFDSQSLGGKVVSGLAKLTRKHGKKVFVLAGSVSVDEAQYQSAGINGAIGCVGERAPLEEVLSAPAEHLKRLAYDFAKAVTL